MLALLLLSGSMMCACGGGGGGTVTIPPGQQTATPTITTTTAQSGAVIVTLADSTSAATIYYTLDGSTPTTSSQIYEAPFLVSSNITVNAMASAPPNTNSKVATQAFTPNISSGALVWSDEFTNSGSGKGQPSATNWTYDTGTNCCGNNELETYCAWASSAGPCDPNNPNAYLGGDGYLHIVAQEPSAGVYTAARLKSQGLFSFLYGRIEARMKLPESQGMWPAFWLLGNNIVKVSWPTCGELDVMEHIDGNNPPPYAGGTPEGYDWIAGSIHFGPSSSSEINGSQQYHATGFLASDWHIYGMIWSKGEIQYYVDDPSNIYATFKSTDSQFSGGTWPFDQGPEFIILNLAVGGDWPGKPDATTVFPSEMSVDYVRIYTN